ncbi:hypothetical protein SEA_SKOG_95 [Gordonia phage Skog]|uniref:Uncharacterized protein n=1 Tax=Gordonia phage Skog TaxID=2704033 RepID=A0A6G6XJK4_9CAUD|nr:hypothetical protein KHQ85_gp095 [Gordonia phage Skog]QIG58247.1 hypothetical protein SEA_SKOG_95 [Gordonia phage Skog]
MSDTPREQITAIFAEEIATSIADHEPTPFIAWLERLRDKVLDVVDEIDIHT